MADLANDLRGLSNDDAEVVLRFLRRGRLLGLPAKRSRRMPVYRWLVSKFEPGREYPESEVNEILARYHPDFALLRRELVVERFLDRAKGVYWRIDGERS